MRWHLIIEEYGPELIYVKGENNIVADALSRLPILLFVLSWFLQDDKEFHGTTEQCFSVMLMG